MLPVNFLFQLETINDNINVKSFSINFEVVSFSNLNSLFFILLHQRSVPDNIGEHIGSKLAGWSHGISNYEKYHQGALIGNW